MFKKLLKYDYMATKRIGYPIIIAILIAGILGSINVFIIKGLIESISDNFFVGFGMFLSIMFFMLVFLVIAGGITALQIIILVDFYKNLGTDEGYLTFTLPVKTRDLIFSKLSNAGIWAVLSSIAAIIAFIAIFVCAIIAIGPSTEPSTSTDVDLGISAGSVIIFLLLSLAFSILYFVNSTLLYFLAIFLGTVIAKKNKGLVAIGSVLVVNMIYGTVTGIVSTIFTISSGALMSAFSDPLAAVNLVTFILTILIAIVNVVFYKLLKNMMDNKLNLA